MTERGVPPTRPFRRSMGQAPSAAADGLGRGDPLVRALATCIRQAHARRLAGRALDGRTLD
jgi:hypothetical protein